MALVRGRAVHPVGGPKVGHRSGWKGGMHENQVNQRKLEPGRTN